MVSKHEFRTFIRNNFIDPMADIFQVMKMVLRDEPSEQNRFQTIIRRILAHMKFDLGAMDPRAPETTEHQEFVTFIHSYLTTFFRDISATDLSDEFFITNSLHPADRDLDSKLLNFVETIRNYSLRLYTVRGRNEINHYVLAVLKCAAVKGNLVQISDELLLAMGDEQGSWVELSHYVMTVLLPSFVHAAFVSEPGWLLAEPLLEAAQEHLMVIADRDRSVAIEGVSEIMSTIVNGVTLLMEAHSQEHVRASTSYELVYVLVMSIRFMVLAFDWLPFTMELCSEQKEEIRGCQAFFYHFACGAKAYLSSPLKHFVNSLTRYVPSTTGSDNRELLVGLYEEALSGDYTKEVRRQALSNLAAPFVRNNEGLHEMRNELKEVHRHRFVSGVWLLHDMRNSSFFKEAESARRNHVVMKIPHFSGVILADYRQNWAECPDSGDIEIKFGQEKGVAKGLMANGRSLLKIFESLRKVLDDYMACYERVHSQRPGWQNVGSDRLEL
jgi:hypothetical protein